MQDNRMEVKDLSWNENQKDSIIPHFLKSIRGLIVRKSGCGKTTLLMNLLLRHGWLDYNNLQFSVKICFNQSIKKAFEEKLSKDNNY